MFGLFENKKVTFEITPKSVKRFEKMKELFTDGCWKNEKEFVKYSIDAGYIKLLKNDPDFGGHINFDSDNFIEDLDTSDIDSWYTRHNIDREQEDSDDEEFFEEYNDEKDQHQEAIVHQENSSELEQARKELQKLQDQHQDRIPITLTKNSFFIDMAIHYPGGDYVFPIDPGYTIPGVDAVIIDGTVFLPLKETALLDKVIYQRIRLTQQEVDMLEKKYLFENKKIYTFIDISKIPANADKKKLNKILSDIVDQIEKNALARYRVKEYKNINNFTLISDKGVKAPYVWNSTNIMDGAMIKVVNGKISVNYPQAKTA